MIENDSKTICIYEDDFKRIELIKKNGSYYVISEKIIQDVGFTLSCGEDIKSACEVFKKTVIVYLLENNIVGRYLWVKEKIY